jgi:predicted phage-related endonuclease
MNMSYKRYRLTKPEHGGQDWLNLRFRDENGNKRISASAAAAIYGLHRFVPADKFAAELMSDTPPTPTEPTWAMKRGNDLEPIVITWVSERLGLDFVTPEEMFCYDDERGARLISTIDGFFESESERRICEIKTYNRPWDPGHFFDYWRIQGIQQAICADTEEITWGIFDGSHQLHIHVQEVTEAEKEEHIEKASEWLSAIDMGMTPPGVSWSFESVQQRYPAPNTDQLVEIDEKYAELVAQLKHVKNELSSYKELEDKLKAELCELIGPNDGATINGTTVATWKGQARSSFDSKSFKADCPELAEKYTKQTIVRTLLLKGAK